MTSTDGWAKWLNTHNTYNTYNAHPSKVKDLCNDTDPSTNFEKLTNSKNIVLLSKAPMGGKCQATFCHSTVGLPILPDDLHHVARSGMTTGTGVEIDIDTVFTLTPTKYTPDLVKMMKIESAEDFRAIKAKTTGPKKKLPTFALLTPEMATAIQQTDMSYANICVAVVKAIKLAANPTPAAAAEAPAPAEETENELLLKMSTPYDSLLYFLWACKDIPKDIKSPTMVNVQNETTVDWEKATRLQLLGTPKPRTEIDLTNKDSSDLSAGAISAMTKLSASMIRHQEATLKAQEEKSDSRLKAWRRLPKIQQNVILLGGVEDDGTVPDEPTEEMLSILGCQNGAQVDQYLRQSMRGYNMSLEPGFCTALNKGMLASPDDTSTPTNFTSFLTPPVNDDEDEEDNANLLKLAVQEKYDNSDLILLTKMEISIAMKTPELKHAMKNIAGVTGRILGQHSIAHVSLKRVADHIEKKETSYNYEFRQEKFFGGNFMDKVNWRLHRFFDSCASGDVTEIDTTKLDFSDMLEQVERREYHTKVPTWIRKLMKKKERKPGRDQPIGKGHGGGGGGGRNGGEEKTRRQFGNESDRSKKIQNPQAQESCMLQLNEQFRDLFHPGNLRNVEKPKLKCGTQICLRYHCIGYCFTDCKFKDGHAGLNDTETASLKSFVEGARASRTSYTQHRNGSNTNPQDQRNTNRQGTRGTQRSTPRQATTNTPAGESQAGPPQ